METHVKLSARMKREGCLLRVEGAFLKTGAPI